MVHHVRRIGTETRVNTSVDGEQIGLKFTELSDGRLLATWEGNGTQPGQQDDRGIFHQLFDAGLTRIGGEVRTSASTTGIQYMPIVQTLSGGRWAEIWSVDTGASTNSSGGIYVQMLDSAGRVGGEFRVDGSPHSPGSLVGTRKLADGGFMVLWEGESTQTGIEDNAGGIFYHRFDANGAQMESAGRVNTTTEGLQWRARFVDLPGGGFGIIWDGNGTQPGHVDNDGAYLQRFDANGNRIGTETLINSPTADLSESPSSFVTLADGGWVISYWAYKNARYNTWQQTFNADGSKRGGPIKLTPEGGSGTGASTIFKALGDGKWMTFWTEGESYTSTDLYYRVFNADGSAAGAKSLATSSTEGEQSPQRVYDLPNGGFMLVWRGKGTQPGQDDSDGYFFQRFDANGSKVGGETRINTTTEGETGTLDMVVLPTGHIVAAWSNFILRSGQDNEADVFQQVFDVNGERVGAETRVATSTTGQQYGAKVKVLGDGSWIVSWFGNGTQPGQEDAYVCGSHSGGVFFQHFKLFEGEAPVFDLVLVGTKRADTLMGSHGNDKLSGKLGKDVLTGGAGQDVFVFDTKPNKKTNLDTITDFSVADDTIWLDNAVFKKLGKGSASKPGSLKKAFFKAADKAKDGNDYLVYNKKTGILYYDADGSGAGKQVEIAKLAKNLKLTAADFFVV